MSHQAVFFSPRRTSMPYSPSPLAPADTGSENSIRRIRAHAAYHTGLVAIITEQYATSPAWRSSVRLHASIRRHHAQLRARRRWKNNVVRYTPIRQQNTS